MLWPSKSDASRLVWASDFGSDMPPCSLLTIHLLPVIRVLFLQGYRTESVSVYRGPPGSGPWLWDVIHLPTLTVTGIAQDYVPEANTLDIVFDVEEMHDVWGPAEHGYALPGVPTRLKYGGPLLGGGVMPDQLVEDIEEFAEAAVDRLVAIVEADGSALRADYQGLLWLFDPDQWDLGSNASFDDVRIVFGWLLDSPRMFLRAQIYDDQAKAGVLPTLVTGHAPNFSWLSKVTFAPPLHFWDTIRNRLQQRGESERLKYSTQELLSSPEAPCWLETLVELVHRDAISIEGLIPTEEPIQTLAAVHYEPSESGDGIEAIELTIWGETRINLTRKTPVVNPGQSGGFSTGVIGSVAWDYFTNRGDKPKVIVVAGRGIEVQSTHGQHLPWTLELIRVQDDALVPLDGAAINPQLLLAPATIDPTWQSVDPQRGELSDSFHSTRSRVVVRGKADGAVFEFPAVVETEEPDRKRLIVEVTLTNPRSGDDAYTYGVYYYEYTMNQRLLVGAHLCIWATAGVKIESSGSPHEDYQSAQKSVMFTASGFKVSAEFWEVAKADDVEHHGIEYLGLPLDRELPYTARLAMPSANINALQTISDGATVVLVPVGDHVRFKLIKKQFAPKSYDDWFGYLVFDVLIGMIPVVGDLTDLAELMIALSTGLDKWGRPITNFDLALMVVGTATPMVSSSFARGVKQSVDARDALDFRQDDLIRLYRQVAGYWKIATEEELAKRAAVVSESWWTDELWQDDVRKQAVREILSFLQRNADEIAEFGARFCDETGEFWLHYTDIYDAANDGFEIHSMNQAYRRWQQYNGGRKDPEAFLASLKGEDEITSSAKIVADTLLGPHTTGLNRRSPRATAQPSRSLADIGTYNQVERALVREIDYSPTPVSPNSARHFVPLLETMFTNLLREGGKLRLFDGKLRPVLQVILDTDLAFAQTAADFLLQAPRAANDPLAFLKTVGNSHINGELLSVAERAKRYVIWLLVAALETRNRGLEPNVLLTAEYLPLLRNFVRRMINGANELGERLELSMAVKWIESLKQHPAVESVATQLLMPLTKTVPGAFSYYKSGPDIVVYLTLPITGRRVAVFLQLKAWRNVLKLASRSSNPGLEFDRQSLSDLTRVLHEDWAVGTIGARRGRVPGPGYTGDVRALPPSDVHDWVDVADVHMFQFDDLLLRNTVLEVVRKTRASIRPPPDGREIILLEADLVATPGDKAMFAELFPKGLRVDTDAMAESTIMTERAWLDDWIAESQVNLNRNINARLPSDYDGRPITVLITTASTPIAEIMDNLLSLLDTP